MPLPDVVETLQLFALDDAVSVLVAVVVTHAEQSEQFCRGVLIDLLELAIGVLDLVEVVHECSREGLVAEEGSVGDTASEAAYILFLIESEMIRLTSAE